VLQVGLEAEAPDAPPVATTPPAPVVTVETPLTAEPDNATADDSLEVRAPAEVV